MQFRRPVSHSIWSSTCQMRRLKERECSIDGAPLISYWVAQLTVEFVSAAVKDPTHDHPRTLFIEHCIAERSLLRLFCTHISFFPLLLFCSLIKTKRRIQHKQSWGPAKVRKDQYHFSAPRPTSQHGSGTRDVSFAKQLRGKRIFCLLWCPLLWCPLLRCPIGHLGFISLWKWGEVDPAFVVSASWIQGGGAVLLFKYRGVLVRAAQNLFTLIFSSTFVLQPTFYQSFVPWRQHQHQVVLFP